MTTPPLIVQLIEEGWNKGHTQVVDEYVSADYRRDIPGGTLISDAVVNGNSGVSRWICTGTHDGELLGVPATGMNKLMLTHELKMSFVRPALPDTLRAEANTVHIGRSIAFLEGRLLDEKGKLIATSTATSRPV